MGWISLPEMMAVMVDDDEGIKMNRWKTKREATMQGTLCGLFAVLRSSFIMNYPVQERVIVSVSLFYRVGEVS